MRSRSRRLAPAALLASAAVLAVACGPRRQPERGGSAVPRPTAAASAPASDPGIALPDAAAAPIEVAPAHTVAPPAVPPPAHPNVLGAGALQTCFIRPGGDVVCWGENLFGVLGDGTEIDRYSPVEVQGLSAAVDLAVGASGTCARRLDGAVFCWGRFGPDIAAYLLPHRIRGLDGVVQLLLAGHRIYGLTAAGAVLYREQADELGGGGASAVAGLADAVELAEDGVRTCARRASGAVACWEEDDAPAASPPVPVDVPGIADAEALWGAWGATWVRRAGGAVWTWGHDVTLDVLADRASPSPPHAADDPGGVLAQAAAIQGRCVLTRDGKVFCRRESAESYALSAAFFPVEFPRPVRALAVGGMHACGLDDAGEVRCFGDNGYGQLGRGDAHDAVSRPTAVPGIADAQQVVAGEWGACARGATGRVTCWSMPWSEAPSPGPEAVEGIVGATALYSGGQYTCAADRRGALRCWGLATWLPCRWESEDNCQPARWDEPRVVAGLAGIAGALEVVGECVRMPDGHVRCVERYDGGPVTEVAGVDDAAGLAGAAWLRCILRRGGGVACLWPEAGRPTSSSAVDLPDVDDAIAVAASVSIICAVHRGGTVGCTELSPREQECDSAAAPCAALHAVEGIGDAVDVVAGSGFACALERGGTVACWGRGEHGVLGDGTTRDSDRPLRVAGLDDAVELVAREDHVCARRAGGSIACWGRILPGLAADEHPSTPVSMP